MTRREVPRFRYARRRVGRDLILLPAGFARLWRNADGFVYAEDGVRHWLVAGREETRRPPHGMAHGLYRDEDNWNSLWINDDLGLSHLLLVPAALLRTAGPWHEVATRGADVAVRPRLVADW